MEYKILWLLLGMDANGGTPLNIVGLKDKVKEQTSVHIFYSCYLVQCIDANEGTPHRQGGTQGQCMQVQTGGRL